MRAQPSAVPLILGVTLVAVYIAAAVRGNDARSRERYADTSSAQPTASVEPARPDPAAGSTQEADAVESPTAANADPTPVPASTGTFIVASASGATVIQPPFRKFAVAIENRLCLSANELAGFIDSTLGYQRSWIGGTVTGFERGADLQEAQFTLVVATPDKVDALCASLETGGTLSCGNNGWVYPDN